MGLLELLSQRSDGYRLSQLGREAGLSPSTTHRLLTTLERGRHVQFDPASGCWHVGRGMLSIGAAASRRNTFVPVAQPFLQHLRDQTRETANLGMPDEGQITLVSQFPSRQIVRSISPIGGRVPMTSSAMGKAILATYSPEEIEAALAFRRPTRRTSQSILHLAAMRAELERARLNGFAIDNAEHRENVRCIASVVFNERAEAVAAISISGQIDRLSNDSLEELVPKVVEAANKITAAIGGCTRPGSSGAAY